MCIKSVLREMNGTRCRHLPLFKEWEDVWPKVPKSVRKRWVQMDAEQHAMDWLRRDLFRGEWAVGVRVVPVRVNYEFLNSEFVGYCADGLSCADDVPMMAMLTHVFREMKCLEHGIQKDFVALPVTAKFVEGGCNDTCQVVGKVFDADISCFVEVMGIAMFQTGGQVVKRYLKCLQSECVHAREVTMMFLYGV